jgi:hypothetical protein
MVHEARDGYLFLAGGNHAVFSYFTGETSPHAGSAGVFWENIANRSAYCAAAGISWRHVVFPEKCVVLRDLLAPEINISSLFLSHYAHLAPQGSAPVLYPLQALTQDAASCCRTDTHYSARGNILITSAILQDLFPEAQTEFLSRSRSLLKTREIDKGDLGRKLSPPRTEVVDSLSKHIVPFEIGSNGISGSDGIMDLIASHSALSAKTLLIFGDSFFRALLPMLAVFYQRIVFCRSRFLHSEIIKAIQPDHIFTGQAERYLTLCTPDSQRPHFLSYPYTKSHTMTPDETFCKLWPKLVAADALLT